MRPATRSERLAARTGSGTCPGPCARPRGTPPPRGARTGAPRPCGATQCRAPREQRLLHTAQGQAALVQQQLRRTGLGERQKEVRIGKQAVSPPRRDQVEETKNMNINCSRKQERTHFRTALLMRRVDGRLPRRRRRVRLRRSGTPRPTQLLGGAPALLLLLCRLTRHRKSTHQGCTTRAAQESPKPCSGNREYTV